tara:strand:+ start:8500 stop:10476 length:1977 start_codon:yes stop_codon:yes gene_type:complete
MAAIIYPTVDSLDICLNLNSGMFEFRDNNDYLGGTSPVPHTIGIDIEHSNGTPAYTGLEDITIDNIFSNLRTYDSSSKLGENFLIPIPRYSSTDYIDDVYKITFNWHFGGTITSQSSKIVYINASDLDLYNDLEINASLTYKCDGRIESNDMTDYIVSATPYTFTRTHELFSQLSLGAPLVTTGGSYTSHELYAGGWNSVITTDIVWTTPTVAGYPNSFIGACFKKTITGSDTDSVNCNIDACVINQFMKNIKKRYDDSVCDRDIINIKKNKAKYQRAIELMVLYSTGDDSQCGGDFQELWDILEIANLDDITSLSCCGDPTVNDSMVTGGNSGGGSGGSGEGSGGSGEGKPDKPTSCPCSDSNYWSAATQMAGSYNVGDYLKYELTSASGTTYELCYELYLIPTGGFNASSVLNEEPGHDNNAYWNYMSCTSYPIVFGCTDPLASNYNADADIDDVNNACTYIVNNSCTGTTAIPDRNFENKLIALGIDSGSIDGSVSNANICSLTTLDVSWSSISDLTGIEGFTSLTDLLIHWNQLTSLDVSTNTALTFLACGGNQLTSIDVSQNTALTFLDFNFNNLTSLNVSTNTALTGLYCSNNQLTSLTLGTGIDLNNLTLGAQNNDASLVIHVGTSARVTLAQSLFTVANLSISTGTTFAI